MNRKFLISLVSVAVLLSFLADFQIYRQNETNNSAAKWVTDNYQSLRAIDKATLALLNPTLSRDPKNFESALKDLEVKVSGNPAEKVILDRIQDIWEGSADFESKKNRILNAFEEMNLSEEALLEQRILAGQLGNMTSTSRMIFANIVDILLIGLLLGLFFYEKRSRHKVETSLFGTLRYLESINESLRATLYAKSLQLKVAVHDLKNPLGSIQGFAELIRHDFKNADSVLEMSKTIQRISANTLNLVGSVLDHAFDEQGTPQSKSVVGVFDLADCVRETCRFLEPTALLKKQDLQLWIEAPELSVRGDYKKIQDAFYNLIGNALKFSPAESTVLVRIEIEGDRARVEIVDQGPGFKAEDRPKLFLPGATLSARPTGDETSTGMGLYSAKIAINEARGEIEILNRPVGPGACVLVRFPLSVIEKQPIPTV